jgi:hypothetical protein
VLRTNKFLSFCFSFVAVEGPVAGSSAMSESEAEEIGHSMTINDELRLCGMAGDDEDDVIGDAEALLGPRAAEELFNRTHARLRREAIAVTAHSCGGGGTGAASASDGDAAAPGAAAATGEEAATGEAAATGEGSVKPSNRQSTSACWEDFEKLFKIVNGQKVRYGARCHHCKKEYTANSKFGTGHLLRHMETCPKKREKNRMTQSHITFLKDGTI